MSRTSAESGEIATQPQSRGSELGKNGAYAAGPKPPLGGSISTRQRSPLHLLLLPIVAAAVCGTGAYVTSNYYMTRWYSAGETIWFPATGNQGASGIISSLMGASSADPTGSVPILGGIYSSPQFGSGPNTAITALDSGRAKGEVMSRLKLAARWHLPPAKAGERFNKNVSYGIDKDGLLAIQATDTDPHLAYEIVNAYVQAMRDVSTELSVKFAHTNLLAVRQKYASAHADLLRQEDELEALQKSRTMTMPLGSAATGAYADVTKQVATTQTELDTTDGEIAAQLRTAKKTYGSSLSLPTSVPFADSTIQDLRKAEQDFQRISSIYSPGYPGYREAQDRVDQAKQQAKAELQRQLAATTQFVSPEMAELYVKRASEQAELASLKQQAVLRQSQMLSLPDADRREADLSREIARSNALDETLNQAVTQAELAEKRDVPTYEVIDPAGVPSDPSLPRVGYMTVFGAVAGFLLALACQVARVVQRSPVIAREWSLFQERYGLAEAAPAAPMLATNPVRPMDAVSSGSLEEDIRRVLEAHGRPALESPQEQTARHP